MSERPDRAPPPPPDAARGTGRTRAAGRMRWDPLWSATELLAADLGADQETVACFAGAQPTNAASVTTQLLLPRVTCASPARGILERGDRVRVGWDVRSP